MLAQCLETQPVCQQALRQSSKDNKRFGHGHGICHKATRHASNINQVNRIVWSQLIRYALASATHKAIGSNHGMPMAAQDRKRSLCAGRAFWAM